MAINGMKDDDE